MSGAGTAAAPCSFEMGDSAEFWAQAGKSAMRTQAQAGRMMAEAKKAMPGIGGYAPAATAFLTRHDGVGQAEDSPAA
ncbi:MAG TPA: hypothetical protein VGC15_01330 [Acetobacteraceae bacterium]